MKSRPARRVSKGVRFIITPDDDPKKSNVPVRKTTIQGPRKDCTVDVIGGSAAVHRSNVQLAESIVNLPEKGFAREARRLLARQY